ncbi:MAG: class I SAM-dependent methyltransferase [Candidatus Heimdallarchaeota archaeon]
MNNQDRRSVWHEEEDFWETFGPVMFIPRQWELAPEQVDQILSLLDIQTPCQVLDLCCGPGRHSLELGRRGFQVTGIDRTKSYLDEAIKRAKEESLSIEFIQADMREFVKPNSFDLVLNLSTSFSYFRDPKEDEQVLKNVYTSLKPGGKFLMEMMGKEVLARIFKEREWREYEPGVFWLVERKATKDWGWMYNRWLLIDTNDPNNLKKEFEVDHRLYSGTDLRTLLVNAGFSEVSIYGDLQGAPYDHDAKEIVGVAIK